MAKYKSSYARHNFFAGGEGIQVVCRTSGKKL